MMVWMWGLIASGVLLSSTLVWLVFRYMRLKRKAQEIGVDSDFDGDDLKEINKDANLVSSEDREHWLNLIDRQREICTALRREVSDSDLQGKSALVCWSIFLDVEKVLIEESVPHEKVIHYLIAFKSILDRIERAQEIEVLLKSLSVNQSLLKEVNKIIQKTGDKAFSEINMTASLNLQLEKLQRQLHHEIELDVELAALRAEIATMCELAERLKEQLKDVQVEGNVDESYVGALEEFLGQAAQTTFLRSMGSELEEKVADLKQLANYQKELIQELQNKVRKVKGGLEHDGKHRHIGSNDILIARLEKSLLESGRVIKRLESKLESLQTIKYNLNVDAVKRDEELKQKKALLKARQAQQHADSDDLRTVMQQEQASMINMEELLHIGPFTEESDVYLNEQTSRIESLRLMVSESELYVEMLERDLDDAKEIHEDLERKIQSSESGSGKDDSLTSSQDLEEMENLKEINEELEREKLRLEAELQGGAAQMDDYLKLKKKLDELDKKIDVVQEKYVEMEEKYLTALMSQEEQP